MGSHEEFSFNYGGVEPIFDFYRYPEPPIAKIQPPSTDYINFRPVHPPASKNELSQHLEDFGPDGLSFLF